MKVLIGADHRGFELKEKLKPWLESQGHTVIDCGNDHYDADDDFVDFGVTIARKVAEDIAHAHEPDSAIGIGICGSGIGISIAVNRFKTIRGALCMSVDHAQHARENDHANVLSLASDYIDEEEAKNIIKTFIKTEPKRIEKYKRRARKLDQISVY